MRIILLISFLSLTILVQGQQAKTSTTEVSLLEKTNLWSVLDINENDHIHPSDAVPNLKSNWFQIGNDSIIKGIIYKKLMKSNDQTHRNWMISGFIRQTNTCVYYLNEDKEYLLYDFGLAVGNTFETSTNSNFNYITRLDSVCTIKMNNAVRKMYYLTRYLSSSVEMKTQEIWIEGIGSISDGLLRQTTLGLTGNSHDYSLLCFHQNGEQLYGSKTFSNCYYDITNSLEEQKVSSQDIQLFPNPTSGQFFIRSTTLPTNCVFELVNISGVIIKRISNCITPLSLLDISDLPNGIYFVFIKTQKEKVCKKIIKK